MVSPLSSAASAKLEILIRRLYSVTLLLSSIESIAIALGQDEYLNWLNIVLVVTLLLTVTSIQFAIWSKRPVDRWIYLLGGFGFGSMLIFPLAVRDFATLTQDFQPWLWWVIGMAVVGMGIVAKPVVSIGYLALVTLTWFWLDTSVWGGGSSTVLTLQDATYLFLFGGTVLGLFILVRESVAKVDLANTAAMQSALSQAKTDAVENERQRLDALIHDRVLNTLLLAAKAESPAEYQAVSKLSEEAITSLKMATRSQTRKPEVQPLDLFRALEEAAIRIVPTVSVEISSSGSAQIPPSVAEALTEALLQALDNASRHSKASQIQLKLGSPSPSSILLELRDNGVGFRPGRVSKDRVGIQVSILRRVEAVGASASIESAPGQGTLVRLQWQA